jgi:3-oxoacyl-[acyl-carrier-protein] synthase II
MGTTSGEPREVEDFDDCWLAEEHHRIRPQFVNRYRCGSIPEVVASEVDFRGPNIMIPTACAAGNYAIAYAFDALRSGRADVMLAGGADCFSRITYSGFSRLGAIASERCQPFDRNRQGMVPGEGAGVVTLETWENAAARGARVYAEVAGYGLSCDADHMTAADGDGAARAMFQALADSGHRPEDVSYVSAHGTGTPTNDRVESAAVRTVFGDHANRLPMSSIKSMIGHTMGAASAIEAAVCALALHEDKVPPTINFAEPDPECHADCVPNVARDMRVDVAMSNAYAFGGNNASLMLRKWEAA